MKLRRGYRLFRLRRQIRAPSSERYSNPSDWAVGWSIAPVTGKPWSRW
jgi:hypothetical protein